jgi:hypothetical protein
VRTSFVRSIRMDTWSAEQVEMMRQVATGSYENISEGLKLTTCQLFSSTKARGRNIIANS